MYTDFLTRAARIVADHRKQYRGVYVLFGGGGPSGNTTTTQNSNPWSGQQPYLTQQYQAAGNLYNNPSDYPQYYPTSTVSPMNAAQTQDISNINNTANNSSLMNADQNYQQYLLGGNMLSAGNPYFQSMANQVTSQVTPQIESQFTQGNSMNNPAAAFATSQGIGNAVGNLAGQNYNNVLQQMGSTANLGAPNTYQTQLTGEQTGYNAEAQAQTQAQNELNYNVNAYNYGQQLPYQALNTFAGNIAGNPGSSTTTSQPYYNNTMSNLFGAGVGLGGDALMAYAMNPAMFSFSDIRLKKNIRRIGTWVKTLPLYEFEYIWGGGARRGVMAHEVEKVMPEAVREVMGFKFVNYGMLANGNV